MFNFLPGTMMTIIILIALVCAVIGYNAGNERQVGGTAGLLLGLFLGIIGVIIVLVSPKKLHEETHGTLNNGNVENTSAADHVMKWHELKEKGAITAEEFEEKKRQLLS